MKESKSQKINSYLSFKLGNEEFALHVSKVLNILEMTRITKVPKAPYYLKGVDLRGKVLPVIDTRLKLGMTETIFTNKTCIIVVELQMDNNQVQGGSLVDEVLAVIELENSQIEPPPSIGNSYKSQFIYGLAKYDENFIMLLEMGKMFSDDDLEILKEKTKKTIFTH